MTLTKQLIVQIGLSALIATAFGLVINFDHYCHPTNMSEYAGKYANSQYVLGDAGEKISDSDLYIYAGFAYVKGEDPTTINFEHPPLAKYLFGLSYWWFGNSLSLNLILYFGIYLIFGLILSQFVSHKFLIFLGMALVALNPLFTNQMQYALLDAPLLFLTLLYFIVIFAKKNNITVASTVALGVILGLLASVKYPFPWMMVPLCLSCLWYFINKSLRLLPLLFIIGLLIYLLQYWGFFIHSHDLLDLIEFEKYRLHWWIGDRSIPPFLIFESLFLGRHHAWWNPGTYQYAAEWNIILPIMFVLSMLAGCHLVKSQEWQIRLIFLFCVLMIGLFAVGSASSLRYLLLLFPFWVLLSMIFIERLLSRHHIPE